MLSRVSPEDLPDSGCTGLLDEDDDEDNCSLQRAGSSTAGEQTVGCVGGNQSSSPGAGAAGVSGRASSGVSGDRDSGGGSVASSCAGGGNSSTGGGYQQRSTKTGVEQQREVVYAQLQKRKSLVNGNSESSSPVYTHQLQKHLQQQLPLLHVDGPLDGSPYAIVNPLVKHKALADSGISVRLFPMFFLFNICVLFKKDICGLVTDSNQINICMKSKRSFSFQMSFVMHRLSLTNGL